MITLKNDKYSISFDNKTYFLLDKKISSVEAKHNTSRTIGQNGVYLENSYLGSRDIQIKGALYTRGEENKYIKTNLINLINPLKQLTLIVNDKKIMCNPSATILFSEEETNDYCEFLIELFCPTPFFEDLEVLNNELSYWLNNFSFPFEIPQSTGFAFANKGNETIKNVYNSSVLDLGFFIKIDVTLNTKNIKVSNINTGENIKINRDLVAGETILINTNLGNKRIESIINNVKTNILNNLDYNSNFFQLHSGDNWLKVEAENGTSGIYCTIQYNNKYLGVE